MVCLIDPVGDVYACPFAIHENFLAGNVRSPGGFEGVWRDSALFADLRRPQTGGACASCSFFDSCQGGCMAAKFFTGLPLDGPDPECVRGFGEQALAARPTMRRFRSRTSTTPDPRPEIVVGELPEAEGAGAADAHSPAARRETGPGVRREPARRVRATRVTLGERVWPEIDGRTTLLVPVGSVEQHGPHLPLDTDTRIAVAVAVRAATGAVLVAPPVVYGASGEHEGFAGTVSIGHEALRLLLVELGRSAARWAGRLVFVNGHGGNVSSLVEAVRLLRYEGRDAAWFPCAAGGDAHAGRTETSLMLALDPALVRPVRAAGNTAPLTTCYRRCAWAEWRP